MSVYIVSETDVNYLSDKVSNIETIVSRCEACSKVIPDVNRIKSI